MSPDSEDYRLATMLRVDPERLASLRRATSGITRCPNCDEPNKADQKFCIKCGAALYPEDVHESAEKPEPAVTTDEDKEK